MKKIEASLQERKFISIFIPLFIFLFFGLTDKLSSQTVTITGPTSVSPGTTEYYEATFDYTVSQYANLSWTVTGGTIISQGINPSYTIFCTVEGDNNPGVGSVLAP